MMKKVILLVLSLSFSQLASAFIIGHTEVKTDLPTKHWRYHNNDMQSIHKWVNQLQRQPCRPQQLFRLYSKRATCISLRPTLHMPYRPKQDTDEVKSVPEPSSLGLLALGLLSLSWMRFHKLD